MSELCADPERFVRWGPTLTTFFSLFLVDEGREDPNEKAGHYLPARETPYKCSFAGVPMMAQH